MLLSVDHVTLYRYDQPVRAVMQSHRLTPARFDGQRVVNWTVTVTGGEMGGGFRDGAGDWVQGWTVKGPVSEVEVRVQGQVETTDLAGMLRGHREVIHPIVYLQPTEATAPATSKTGVRTARGRADRAAKKKIRSTRSPFLSQEFNVLSNNFPLRPKG